MQRGFHHGLLTLLLSSPLFAQTTGSPAVVRQPAFLSYADVQALYQNDVPAEGLRGRLDRLLATPVVNNAAADAGKGPRKPRLLPLGRGLRVAQWNIERGVEFDALRAAFKGRRDLERLLPTDEGDDPEDRRRALGQADLLADADVVVLNEVDWGMPRSGYRNVAGELASALQMNYVYGVEFVEVDPITMGLEEHPIVAVAERTDEPAHRDQAAMLEHLRRDMRADPARYRGLHGNAILSRYRLQNVRLLRFKAQGHDWYATEKAKTSPVERARRGLTQVVFQEEMVRQVRRGGRMALIAEIVDRDLPGGRATIVAAHLEAQTKPEERQRQLAELLDIVKPITQPVVIAGDMNTSGYDSTPTSVRRELKKRFGSASFWAEEGIKAATGLGLVLDIGMGLLKSQRVLDDPTVRDVPVVAPNPEGKFFEMLEDFRFSDGGAFDLRGEPARAIDGQARTLADANERDEKGFVQTFEMSRTIGPEGKRKLDWIFVKPGALKDPRKDDQPFRFAPHYGRTLKELNRSIPDRISDHHPILVDLPFTEPRFGRVN